MLSLIAMSLQNLEDSSKWGDNISMLGSMLYKRNVFGARVVARYDTKEIEGVEFRGFIRFIFYIVYCY
jgi:hypothetical protein